MKNEVDVKKIDLVLDKLTSYELRLSIVTEVNEMIEISLPRKKFLKAINSIMEESFIQMIEFIKEELEELKK